MTDSALVLQLKKKREAWTQCFLTEDRNSIVNQIYQVVWNAGVYHIINDSRRINAINNNGRIKMNGVVHEFIDLCYFNSQFAAIRRLIDGSYLFDDSKRGIVSLVSLLTDIKKNVHLFTRENVFAAEGLEYDPKVLDEKGHKYLFEHSKGGTEAVWIPREYDSYPIRYRHNQIDTLSGTSRDNRTPTDMIRKEIVDSLICKLQTLTKDIHVYVDKYLAHAASQASREAYNADEINITLKSMLDAIKGICRVASFISDYFIGAGGHEFLPIVQADLFEHIDKPMVSMENIEAIREAWRSFSREVESWGSGGQDDLLKEIIAAIKVQP